MIVSTLRQRATGNYWLLGEWAPLSVVQCRVVILRTTHTQTRVGRAWDRFEKEYLEGAEGMKGRNWYDFYVKRQYYKNTGTSRKWNITLFLRCEVMCDDFVCGAEAVWQIEVSWDHIMDNPYTKQSMSCPQHGPLGWYDRKTHTWPLGSTPQNIQPQLCPWRTIKQILLENYLPPSNLRRPLKRKSARLPQPWGT